MDVAGGGSWKSNINNKKQERHDEITTKFHQNPGLLGIDDLNLENVIFRKISPKNQMGKEIGDLIFVTLEAIYIIEVTLGGSRKIRKDSFKLKKSRCFFLNPLNKAKFLRKNGLPPKDARVKGIIASYEGRWLHEGPNIFEIFCLEGA